MWSMVDTSKTLVRRPRSICYGRSTGNCAPIKIIPWVLCVPKVIMISNDPLGIASGSRKISQAKSTLREANQHKPGTFLEDALAPLYTLFSTREARGSYAQRAISTEQDHLCETIAHSPLQTQGRRWAFTFSASLPRPSLSPSVDAFQRRRQSDAGRDE